MRLIPGMYGEEFNAKRGLFDLHCGQMSGGGFGHNSGWYNVLGEKIGWGDLDKDDMRNIMDGLEDGEMFITMGEQDSFWAFTEKAGGFGWLNKQKPTEQKPGLDYVIGHCRYIIVKGHVFRRAEYGKKEPYEYYGVWVEEIENEEADEFIREYNKNAKHSK